MRPKPNKAGGQNSPYEPKGKKKRVENPWRGEIGGKTEGKEWRGEGGKKWSSLKPERKTCPTQGDKGVTNFHKGRSRVNKKRFRRKREGRGRL